MLSICLINRNYPPLPGATGYYATQLVDRLEKAGYQCHVVTIGKEHSNDQVTYLRPRLNKGNNLGRLLGSYQESKALIMAAKKSDFDLYIVMTDPPLLNYWAAKLFKQKTWVNWSMDIYPQGFLAKGLVSERSFAYKLYQWTLKRGVPNYLLALGQQQLKYLRAQYGRDIQGSWLPIGLRTHTTHNKGVKLDSISVGYVGNIGEAHDPIRIASALSYFVKKGIKVILRVYGAGSESLLRSLSDDVVVKERLSDEELADIDLQLISLRPEWTHICVPSKAISAVQSGNAILYLGETRSDTWQMLGPAGWIVTSESDIEEVLSTVTIEGVIQKKAEAEKLRHQLEEHYEAGLSDFFAFLNGLKAAK